MMGAREYQRGSILVVVLISLTSLLILLVAMMSVVGSERKISSKYSDAYRAELAVESGLAEVTARLKQVTDNDDYLIIKRNLWVEYEGVTYPRSYYYAARGESAAEPVFSFSPLFSSEGDLPSLTFADFRSQEALRIAASLPSSLEDVPFATFDPEKDLVKMSTQPWQYQPVVQWRNIYDEGSPQDMRPIARYAYWIEDMEGYLDGMAVGNLKGGKHQRVDVESLAPGLSAVKEMEKGKRLNEVTSDLVAEVPPLASVELNSLFGDKNEKSIELEDRLIEARLNLIEDEFKIAREQIGAEEIPAFFGSEDIDDRVPLNADDPRRVFKDSEKRVADENLVLLTRGYDEQPRVPFVVGLSPSVMGKPQKSLNRAIVNLTDEEFVTDFADWVEMALPQFSIERKGGFPENYLKTLAANIRDYIDEDDQPTGKEGEYHGIDKMPLVNEYAMRIRWNSLDEIGGRQVAKFEIEIYAELWNMTTQDLSGNVQISFDSDLTFEIGTESYEVLAEDVLDDESLSTHDLVEIDGRYFSRQTPVSLLSNEMKLVSFGKVDYMLDVGPASVGASQVSGLSGKNHYRLLWNGDLADKARQGIQRRSINLKMANGRPDQQVRCGLAGFVFETSAGQFSTTGDPRISYYCSAGSGANAYPFNWSPGRRNVRLRIYEDNGFEILRGRVLTSEWPDGGHDVPFGAPGFSGVSELTPPDAAIFQKNLPPLERDKAMMPLPENGIMMQSETELSHIFDPVMWDVNTGVDRPKAWRDIDVNAQVSGFHGGGNSLRIGRPEHTRFDKPGVRASHLLDLFYAGYVSTVQENSFEQPYVRRRGHVNLNTASKEVIATLVVGDFVSDPALARQVSRKPDELNAMLRVRPLSLGAGFKKDDERAGDVIANAIVKGRPFASVSELAHLQDSTGKLVFGNKEQYQLGEAIQWNDRAAEELFARVYNSSTLRSRNFRVYVIGQILSKSGEVLATQKRRLSLFADPGERDDDGNLDPKKLTIQRYHAVAN